MSTQRGKVSEQERRALPDYDEDLPVAKQMVQTTRDYLQTERESSRSRGGRKSPQSRKEKHHLEK